MDTSSSSLPERYAHGLTTFHATQDQALLNLAQAIGREAMDDGASVTDIVSWHRGALAELGPRHDSQRVWLFFTKALGAFEIELRSAQSLNERLEEAVCTLEQKVEERTQLLSNVVDSIDDGVVVADKDGQILFANAAARRLLSLGLEEELLRRSLLRDPPKEPVSLSTPAAQLLSVGAPLKKECGVEGGVLVFRDVTELRRTEEQLRQSQKMDAIGRLAGGIAHDFNNLLSVIISFAAMAMEELAPGSQAKADLQEIHRASHRAAELTKQLLMFARYQPSETRVLDLNAVLGNLEKMLRRLIGEDIDYRVTLDDAVGKITADESGLEQVIMNLVINARDAMPRGGKLRIETAQVMVDEEFARVHLGTSPGSYIVMSVIDSGHGMDHETQARMFEPFFTTKESGKGTGLGLSTVFGIVKKIGGSIWVYSEVGVGTCFKIYLPLAHTNAVVSTAPTASVDLHGTETILLVEDDDQLRLAAKQALKAYGYGVEECKNAGEALLWLEHPDADFQLLLTDVVMPRMSGLELANRLSKKRPEMKVLCMSGYPDEHLVDRDLEAAHISFLQKPISPDVLAKRVREILDD